MFPSMYARPGQRVHVPTWAQVEQVGRSRARIERTSSNCGECCQMSMNFCCRTLPLGKRELHAREDVAVRRNVAGGVPGAAREAVHNVFAGRGRRRAEFFHVADQFLVAEDLLELRSRDAQREDGCVSVHLRA